MPELSNFCPYTSELDKQADLRLVNAGLVIVWMFDVFFVGWLVFSAFALGRITPHVYLIVSILIIHVWLIRMGLKIKRRVQATKVKQKGEVLEGN